MDEDLKNNTVDETNENDGETNEPEVPPTDPDNPEQPETPPDEPEEPNRDNWTYKDIFDFYERVRLALNAVSSVTLPDKYMDYPEKAPFAEAYTKSRVPKWKELDESKFAIFESIIVYKTASLFQSLVSNKRIKKKAIPTITLEYFDNDGTMDIGLDDWIEYLFGKLNEDEETTASFIGFRVTDTIKKCGRRVYGGYGYYVQ